MPEWDVIADMDLHKNLSIVGIKKSAVALVKAATQPVSPTRAIKYCGDLIK